MDDQGIPVCNSLLPTEFDAVAVLNQMSSSNVPFVFEHERQIETPTGAQTAVTEDKTETNLIGRGSLFSKVVRELNDKKI